MEARVVGRVASTYIYIYRSVYSLQLIAFCLLVPLEKYLNECKVILHYLVADDSNGRVHLVNCVLGTDR